MRIVLLCSDSGTSCAAARGTTQIPGCHRALIRGFGSGVISARIRRPHLTIAGSLSAAVTRLPVSLVAEEASSLPAQNDR